MRKNIAAVVVLVLTAALLTFTLARRRAPDLAPLPEPTVSPEIVDAVTAPDDHKIGAGRSFGGLTVFPVLAEDQPDLGRFVTLEQALADKTAEVRETDESGRVNELVIANKGDKSIFVLAGTVVKGGKQDRQIAQDFAVGPGQTIPVGAFCVEPHRWDASRQGVATKNRFGASKTLATSGVRAAGQYKKDQRQVWSKVGEVNAENGKAPATGSLAASLDDAELAGKRAALAQQVAGFVDALAPQQQVVGIAYAVEGQVKSVRWFANHELYTMYREALFNTAALEEITAEPSRRRRATVGTPPRPEDVRAFVAAIEKAQVSEEKDTAGQNVNAYKESGQGFGSSAKLKAPRGGGSKGKKATISADFTAK